MTRPFDIENALAIVARARATADPITVETARLAEVIADGFRADFDATLDMETVGQALVVAAASVTNMAAAEIGMPAAVIVNMIGFTGESLVRAARFRAAEARDVEGVLCEHVLTWHLLDAPDDAPGVEIPLYQHIELPAGLGELRSHTRELGPAGEGESDANELVTFVAPSDWREQIRDVADVAGQVHLLETWVVSGG